MSDPRPCPFCGAIPVLEATRDPAVSIVSTVTCKRTCPVLGEYAHLEEWNTRATDETMRAEIERLRRENEALKQGLKPTDADRDLAAQVRDLIGVDGIPDEMMLELAAQQIERGQYYECGDFGLVIANEDQASEIERLWEALRTADCLRQCIRAAGIKRHPGIYEAVMGYDATRQALGDKQ